MQRLLLQYQAGDDVKKIQSYLEGRLPYEIHLSSQNLATENLVTSRLMHLVVLSVESLSVEVIQQVRELRSLGYSYPVLLLADDDSGINTQNLAKKHKVHVLPKPFELRSLYGLCRKLMATRNITPQVHRRFKTSQKTVVEAYLSGSEMESHMFNLSAGGAYFEFAAKPEVGVGDLVRMKIKLPDVDREHAVSGKVIWTTHKGIHSGGHGCGIAFIKGADVYRQLMEKV